MAVIGINYKELSKEENLGYESVYIFYGRGRDEKKIFDSGNFVKDWYDCMKFIIMELGDTEYHFSNSSSVNHFIMDGAKYDSAYLVVDEDANKDELQYDYIPEYIEFFVEKGTNPTWKELKVLVGDIK